MPPAISGREKESKTFVRLPVEKWNIKHAV